MSVNSKAREFVYSIMETREFIALKEAKANIDKNPKLKNEVDAFMNKQIFILFYY
ncbi:MAG: hypothetical protein PWP27_1098 [Clostridiales bacterium]|jgi:cell fate (sporulation/competence/biofilm development) regulator YlbF (YheA/YmcA/DUF963 family)|nr:hypothetical protein [Clostridiales bacterium]MDK2933288.1 hypothetical protein [Clostridiales bacterium]